MPSFSHNGVEIAFLDEGEGEPIVLVHGFASNKEINWVGPGWMSTLTRAGRRAIALDDRGHGASSKLYDPAAYHSSRMAEDVSALLDHLGLPRADVMGYSMGARIAAYLALAHPDRVRSVVLGGLGIRLVEGVGLPDTIADALEAPSLSDVTDPTARMFRAFAEQTKSDLTALAACLRGSRQTLRLAPKPGALPCRSWSRWAVKTRLPVRRRNSPRSSLARGPSSFPAATTCWRLATRPSSRRCWTSWPHARDLGHWPYLFGHWLISLGFWPTRAAPWY